MNPTLIPISADNETRCQSRGAFGQCPLQALPGTSYCSGHSDKRNNDIDKEAVRNYNLTKWRHRISQYADNEQIKSIREEIGIMRMMLEETLNRCQDNIDLLIYSSRISDLAMKIKDLVVACHKMESSLGILIDKSVVVSFATQIVEIVSKHLPDQDALEIVGTEVLQLVTSLRSEEDGQV